MDPELHEGVAAPACPSESRRPSESRGPAESGTQERTPGELLADPRRELRQPLSDARKALSSRPPLRWASRSPAPEDRPHGVLLLDPPAPAPGPRPRNRRRRNALRVLLGLLLLYVSVFNFSVVRGSSMAPGIHDGDRILIDQLSTWLGDLRRGDVVVLRYPRDPRVEYIKRIIGLPGDEIVMAGGMVWVNGRLLDEPYVGEFDPASWSRVRVREDHVWVLGDNRPHSSDSREFGQVPRENVRGKVDFRVWPPERIGPIH